jgi:hypothetical protein
MIPYSKVDIRDNLYLWSMAPKQIQNRRITQWLLPVVLILSLFSFTGASHSSPAKQFRATTEQVVFFKDCRKKSASFRIVTGEVASESAYSTANFRYAEFLHGLVISVQLNHCDRQCLEFILISDFMLHLPKQLVDEFSISHVG